MSSHNRNPTGRNQHHLPSANDPWFADILRGYHAEHKTSNTEISQLLLKEYGIEMSASTVKNRRKELGLTHSRVTIQRMELLDAEQLVLNQLSMDVAGRSGIRTIWHKIAFNQGVHLPRDFVEQVMRLHAPDGFAQRAPMARRIPRSAKHPIGIHEAWSADGHDKLYSIGFPIYGIVDDATGKWLGLWVVPSNRRGHTIAFLLLELIIRLGGMPLQLFTDHGSETTRAFGVMKTLRELFAPDIDMNVLPPHCYLRSVHNISIERSWRPLRAEVGDTAVRVFEEGRGNGTYNDQDPIQFELVQWLWSKLLQQELDNFAASRNAAPVRKQKDKAGPSGMSRNDAYREPEKWNGRDCMIHIPPEAIPVLRELQGMQLDGTDSLISFSTPEYTTRAEAEFDSLKISKLTLRNVWAVFREMLARVKAWNLNV